MPTPSRPEAAAGAAVLRPASLGLSPAPIDRVEGEPGRRRRGRSRLARRQLRRPRPVQQRSSKIRVRLYAWEPDVPLDEAFFRERLAAAVALRRDVLGAGRPGPGLPARLQRGRRPVRADRRPLRPLAGRAVHRASAWPSAARCSPTCSPNCVQPEGIYLRTERGIGQLEGLELHDGPLRGDVAGRADRRSTSTGCGSRCTSPRGRRPASTSTSATTARRWPGWRRAGACSTPSATPAASACTRPAPGRAEVLGVDVSEPALALARRNAELNGLGERDLRASRRLRHARRPGRRRASSSAWSCSTRRSSPAPATPSRTPCAATAGCRARR